MTNYVWAVTMMKDEEDVAYHTLMHMAEEAVDGIIVADNMSTDGTRGELERAKRDAPCRVIILEDKDPGYYQSRKMTTLAKVAHDQYDASWIVPFDADELWYSTQPGEIDRVGHYLRSLESGYMIVKAPLYNHFASAVDGTSKNPFESMEWRQAQPGALPKVAARWHESLVIEQGNHGAHYDERVMMIHPTGGLELRHFPYRSFEQFVRKAKNGAAAYNATNLHETMGAHWRQYGALLEKWGEDVLRREVWEKYFWFYSPVDEGMVRDPAPFRRWSR